RLPEGRDRQVVADHQGSRRLGAVTTMVRVSAAADRFVSARRGLASSISLPGRHRASAREDCPSAAGSDWAAAERPRRILLLQIGTLVGSLARLRRNLERHGGKAPAGAGTDHEGTLALRQRAKPLALPAENIDATHAPVGIGIELDLRLAGAASRRVVPEH